MIERKLPIQLDGEQWTVCFKGEKINRNLGSCKEGWLINEINRFYSRKPSEEGILLLEAVTLIYRDGGEKYDLIIDFERNTKEITVSEK
ncbi:MAG TPA: hypothetical protein VMG59_09880 [Phycisphaerae bacterium]|nr:hypothetical protein [Phycisphaerae bacterium]